MEKSLGSMPSPAIVIVPSARMVVVRLGMAPDRYEDIDRVARLVAAAIARDQRVKFLDRMPRVAPRQHDLRITSRCTLLERP